VYFTLILVFFVSVAGITLRKHFDKPYVKPLIISVGLMLTVGVFRFKDQVVEVFEGWGILGTILLVVMAATIPTIYCHRSENNDGGP
jgi:p-aminobenzoyl-glutamate transporter AbgT